MHIKAVHVVHTEITFTTVLSQEHSNSGNNFYTEKDTGWLKYHAEVCGLENGNNPHWLNTKIRPLFQFEEFTEITTAESTQTLSPESSLVSNTYITSQRRVSGLLLKPAILRDCVTFRCSLFLCFRFIAIAKSSLIFPSLEFKHFSCPVLRMWRRYYFPLHRYWINITLLCLLAKM